MAAPGACRLAAYAALSPDPIEDVNFVKTGNPNGSGLPNWPAYRPHRNYQQMRIDVTSQAEPEAHRDRYLALDDVIGQ